MGHSLDFAKRIKIKLNELSRKQKNIKRKTNRSCHVHSRVVEEGERRTSETAYQMAPQLLLPSLVSTFFINLSLSHILTMSWNQSSSFKARRRENSEETIRKEREKGSDFELNLGVFWWGLVRMGIVSYASSRQAAVLSFGIVITCLSFPSISTVFFLFFIVISLSFFFFHWCLMTGGYLSLLYLLSFLFPFFFSHSNFSYFEGIIFVFLIPNFRKHYSTLCFKNIR